MRRFLTLARYLLAINLRDRASLFWFLVFPVLLLVLLGGVLFRGMAFGDVHLPSWFMAGIVVMNILNAGLAGDSAWLVELRERGVLLRVRASPLPPAVLIGAFVTIRLLLVLVQSALIVAVGVFALGARIEWGAVAAVAGFVVLGGVAFLLLGQAIGALSPTARSAEVTQNAMFFPLLFLSDLVVQTDSFPSWLHEIRRWNPAYMLVDLVRPALTGYPAAQAAWVNLLGLGLWSALGLAVAVAFFRWAPRS